MNRFIFCDVPASEIQMETQNGDVVRKITHHIRSVFGGSMHNEQGEFRAVQIPTAARFAFSKEPQRTLGSERSQQGQQGQLNRWSGQLCNVSAYTISAKCVAAYTLYSVYSSNIVVESGTLTLHSLCRHNVGLLVYRNYFCHTQMDASRPVPIIHYYIQRYIPRTQVHRYSDSSIVVLSVLSDLYAVNVLTARHFTPPSR